MPSVMEAWFLLPEGGWCAAWNYPGDPMAVPLNACHKKVEDLLKKALARLDKPDAPLACIDFRALDDALRELLRLDPHSDYGHSRWLVDMIASLKGGD